MVALSRISSISAPFPYIFKWVLLNAKETFYSRQFIFQEIRNKTLGLMLTSKRNVCVSFALSNTHLKMYGKGAEIDEIRESATIDVSIDISLPNVIIAFNFLEHM